VNIWLGGPLDPRRDPKIEDEQCNLEKLERFGPFAVVFEEGDLPVPGHLPLLRMCDDDECLVVFGRIKRALDTRKANHAIRVMLEDRNWRPHLVAAVALTIRDTQDQGVDLLWAAMDSGSWVSPQLAVVARALDSNFAVNARSRILTGCPITTPQFDNAVDRHSATGPKDTLARSVKTLSSLVALLEPQPPWLAEVMCQSDTQSALPSDRNNGAFIATGWAARLASVHSKFSY